MNETQNLFTSWGVLEDNTSKSFGKHLIKVEKKNKSFTVRYLKTYDIQHKIKKLKKNSWTLILTLASSQIKMFNLLPKGLDSVWIQIKT